MFCFILLQLWFHVQQNKINAATIFQALAGLLQHALILFYCTCNHNLSLTAAAFWRDAAYTARLVSFPGCKSAK